jgi:hypothetical protein
LRAWLGAAQSHVTEHFRFEKQNGYMDAVRKREPRLERAVQQLAEEHRDLARSLTARREQAETVTNLDDRFREVVRGCLDRIRQHEARENQVAQDAFNLDISTED